MKDIFNAVLTALKNVPDLYVAENWGQLNIEQPPVNFPCALIDLGEATYSQLSRQAQQADLEIQITLADLIYNGIDQGSPEEEKERELRIFDLINTLHRCLHGLSGATFSPMHRIHIAKTIREDAIREFVIRYRCGYTDRTAVETTSQQQVLPAMSIKKASV